MYNHQNQIEGEGPSRRARLVGRTIAHYRVSAAIGAGGMGEVYRATDTKLGREVALKVLPQNVASDPDRLTRFQREARAVAALNHPNIVTLYSVEESDGIHFLTMELVEGQALEQLIPAKGLPLERIVEIAGALAEALATAHEKGILHRDLKPANVMVTNDGRVKVLDFGLAKDVGVGNGGDATLTSAGQTQAGMVMGTPAYMSPEQVSGRMQDHRTDIFSLGVLLHEMATGSRPFEGESSAELISAILRDSPRPVTEVRSDLPDDLARVIRRCLEKDPRRRVQTARDVANEFRDMTRSTSRPAPTRTSTTRAAKPYDSGAARADEGFWVAVLPFKYTGSNADLTGLAEGLSDDITTGMSRFSYLRVIARSSTARYAQQTGDVRAIGRELGARYVMEGSLRQAGSKLRVAAQLVDTVSGAHLWAETYERVFYPESLFEVQDDLVPRIVATVADQFGVLPRSMSEVLRSKSENALTPHETVLRAFSYFAHITPDEHATVRQILERSVREAPEHADSWALLSMMYRGEFAQGFNAGPNPLERALGAARRSVDLAPTHALGHYALATVHFFRKEIVSFRVEAEKTLSLNPLDASAKAYLGLLIASAGEWERGCEMVESAMQLNPNCPGYFYFAGCWDAYLKGKYEEVLKVVARINMPSYFHVPAVRAAALGQLGRREEAQKALEELLALRPDFAAAARQEYAKWFDAAKIEKMVEGLCKAGLEIPAIDQPAARAATVSTSGAAKSASGASQADEGSWVAALPFKYGGGNADLKTLADGLWEEVVAGLSRFSYLRLVARGSAAKYSSESGDVCAVGKELGARYVMDGSLRQAGNKVRVAARLLDTETGAHLWVETYERVFQPESVFEIQDDVVPRIVSTVADTNGFLTRSISSALRGRAPEELTPHQAALRAFGYFERVTPQELDEAIAGLQAAERKAPGNADLLAMQALLWVQGYAQGFHEDADLLDKGIAAAKKAVEAAPANHLGWYGLAQARFFQKDFTGLRNGAERALALNPMDGTSMAGLAEMLAYAGDWERGLALAERARQLNPHHPGWYWHVNFNYAYRQRDYHKALEYGRKMSQRSTWGSHALTAAAYGQLGDRQGAAKAMQELWKMRPDAAAKLKSDAAKWFDTEYGAHLLEGFEKALSSLLL